MTEQRDPILRAYCQCVEDKEAEIERVCAKFDAMINDRAQTITQLAPDQWIVEEDKDKALYLFNPYYQTLAPHLRFWNLSLEDLKTSVLDNTLALLRLGRGGEVATLSDTIGNVSFNYTGNTQLRVNSNWRGGSWVSLISVPCAIRVLTQLRKHAALKESYLATLTKFIVWNFNASAGSKEKQLLCVDKLPPPNADKYRPHSYIRVPKRSEYYVVVYYNSSGFLHKMEWLEDCESIQDAHDKFNAMREERHEQFKEEDKAEDEYEYEDNTFGKDEDDEEDEDEEVYTFRTTYTTHTIMRDIHVNRNGTNWLSLFHVNT